MDSREWPTFRTLILIFLLAVAVRLGGVVVRGEYRPAAGVVVGGEAGAMAEHLLDGRGFATPFEGVPSPSTHLPPVLPLLVAGVLGVQRWWGGGAAPGAGVFYAFFVVNLAASSLVPVVGLCVCRAARWPRAVGMVGAVAMCFCPEAIRSISLVWDEALTALAVALLVWWVVWLLREADGAVPRDRAAMGVGLASGVLTLLNPGFLPATVAGWGAAVWAGGGRPGAAVRQAAIIFIFAIVGGLPWHLRNWVFLEPPARVFVRGNYWLEIWTSIHPIRFEVSATGQKIPHAVHPWWGTNPLVREGRALTEQEYFAWCKERAVAWIRANPGAYAEHVLRQVDGFWLGIAEAERWEKPWWAFFIPQGIPALAGLAGWWVGRRRAGRGLWAFFVTVLAVFPLPYYFAGAALRYRHPIDLVIYLGIGWLGYGVWGWWRGGDAEGRAE